MQLSQYLGDPFGNHPQNMALAANTAITSSPRRGEMADAVLDVRDTHSAWSVDRSAVRVYDLRVDSVV